MDVHDPVGIRVDEHPRDDLHVPCQRHQLDVMLPQNIQDCPVVRFAAIGPVFIRRRVQEHVRHSMAARALEGLCVLLVADDHGNPGQ